MIEDDVHEENGVAKALLATPNGVVLENSVAVEPTQAAAAAIDRHVRQKARKTLNRQEEMKRMFRPQLSRGKLANKADRTMLFKNSPSESSTGEGALESINEPPPKSKPDPEDDTSLSLAERTFKGMFKTNDFNFDDLLPWRLRTVYRIVREMARLRNLVTDGDLLSEIETDYDHWLQPMPLRPEKMPRDISQALETVQIMAEAEMLPRKDQYSRPSYQPGVDRFKFRGIALLPPPVPDRFIDQYCQVSDEYDPYEDTALVLYIEAIDSIVRYLRINQGCEMDPQIGALGMRGMLDPEVIRLIFPTRTQFMAWEELLVEQVIDKLVELGTLGAQKYLKQCHGYVAHEVANVIKTCKIMISRRNEFDPDEERAMMALRIEDYLRRSRDACDLKAESFGLKQLSLIQGLGKTDPEDANNDMFIAIARKVSSMRPSIDSTAKVLEP